MDIRIILLFSLVDISLAQEFKSTFTSKCLKFPGKSERYEHLWKTFEQAYVGKDPCKVPTEAYDLLINEEPINACKPMLFWSKTKGLLDNLKKCFFTVEDTLLGFVLDGLTWCGKEGSPETFSTGCPEWSQCENNPVRSFWNRLSAAFADAASNDVYVLLNGSIDTPFDPNSVFATVEVKRLHYPKVKSLTVVLVTPDKGGTNCRNDSLSNLKKQLAKKIKYKCKKFTQSNLQSINKLGCKATKTGCFFSFFKRNKSM